MILWAFCQASYNVYLCKVSNKNLASKEIDQQYGMRKLRKRRITERL